MRYRAIERACFVVLLGLLPFAAFAYERSAETGRSGSPQLAVRDRIVATVRLFAPAPDLSGCVERPH